MYHGMQYFTAIMSMTTTDGTQNISHLIYYRKLFIFIIYHFPYYFNAICYSVPYSSEYLSI